MKNVLRIHRQPEGHWVGDGFPVHTVLDYQRHPELSPFLLLDHAGPADFAPAEKPRGVGWHPHRGFETVTLVLDGEVDHEDTAGNGGRIGPGEVQWMTAGSGLLHKEMHSPEFTRRGGKFHPLQFRPGHRRVAGAFVGTGHRGSEATGLGLRDVKPAATSSR